MIKRYLALYPAIVEYAFRVHRETNIPILSHKQYETLQDIAAILEVAHNAQEALSAEKTPTLALAFPIYETVIETWDQFGRAIPELGHAIWCGIRKINEYIDRTQDAPVHTLAMAVNPTLKLQWINAHRTPQRAQEAELVVKREMLRVLQLSGNSLKRYREENTGAADAARAQWSGYMRLLARASEGTVSRASERARIQARGAQQRPEDVTLSESPHIAPAPSNPFASIEGEFVRYMSAGTASYADPKSESMGSVELVDYWKVHQYTYPLLYRIAMNVLPAQASSVSSERVFSSSKMTCTSERSRLSTESVEYLQVLKHALVRRRRTRKSDTPQDDGVLDFVAHTFSNLEISADDDDEE
ncbi:hypothetical protein BN14_12147 [Rhizoctonia solani AG-1 IB]|uniref:HAT C-terminal dimerisation domain-containing protein n=1 Tax=Thanatephorus cucumeris (strain AG1-IB / isolate 7/3/14) TaxID=1108050 RepID=M5CEW7_THACB|nr:hypothetical protein BN14_12147 [Rhizoctonia solani AG-1 IB]